MRALRLATGLPTMRGCACPALLLLLACVSRSGQSMTLRAGQNRLLVPSQRSDVASFKVSIGYCRCGSPRRIALRCSAPVQQVMDVLKNAQQLEALGHPVLHLEPSTSAPEIVKAAAAKALAEDKLGYTEAKGIMTLREVLREATCGVTTLTSLIVGRCRPSSSTMKRPRTFRKGL
eukprot:scaffold3323_cov279-Pinguiococcus_pyrenoidosus.AAC.2